MTPDQLYALIYELAETMEMDEEELSSLLTAADKVIEGSMLEFWDMPQWADRASFTRIDFVRRQSA